jgi:signal transduction histidine kinase
MAGRSTIVAAPPPSRTQMAARRAALFFFVAGLLALLGSFIAQAAQAQRQTFITLGLLDIVIALVLYRLPWSRWSPRSLLAIIPPAFVMIGLFYHSGAAPLTIYPIFFILIFIWVGLSLPPWASLALAPITAAAYVLPLLWPGPYATAIDSAIVAVPICTLIGEVIGHVMNRLRAVQEGLEEQVAERTAELRIANTELQRELAERKQIEAALAAERASLAGQVAERTADLSAANAELARAARLKDEFLASMSHELRTPLNAILGMSQALQEQIYGGLTSKQAEALQTIGESGEHLLGLINDILDLAKIEAGKMELAIEPIEPATIAQASLRLVEQSAREKGLRIITRFDGAVQQLHADARGLKQILVNLLSNAVKFTPAGGQVGLEIVGDATQGRLFFTVWDSGIGIAEANLAQIFQPFVQIDGRLARAYVGTGLGLALVSRLVDLHGGSIQVTSALSQGSRFTVALPWRQSAVAIVAREDRAALAKAAGDIPAIQARHQRVLVAEDNPANLVTLANYLVAKGYQVVTAHDGAEALARARENRPDVILMDIQMPGMDGLEATKRIRVDPTLAGIPIIALTALAMPGDRERCLAAGVDVYLPKPIHLPELVATIETYLPVP